MIPGSTDWRNRSSSRPYCRNETVQEKPLWPYLAAYLNGLEGKGVHVVTVNDYLANRYREFGWEKYTKFLGLTWVWVIHGITSDDRMRLIKADIPMVQQ
jgi:preprotein translocase subunit SecA